MTILRSITIVTNILVGASMWPGNSQTTPPHELCGFLLEQEEDGFEHTLGKPFNSGTDPGGEPYKAYVVPNTTESYLVAVFRKGRAVKLELTGKDYRGPTGFFGLTLGQDASSIEGVLGKPSEIKHEDDVNVDLWDYNTSNYTLEFTADHRLYSIQIVEGAWQEPNVFAGGREVRKFALAVQAGDMEGVMQMSSGSLICTKGTEVGFTGAARMSLGDTKGQLAACLKAAAKAVLALGPEMVGTDNQLRIAEKRGPFCVTKFDAPSQLKEVVFTWEVNTWRVYEVTFR